MAGYKIDRELSTFGEHVHGWRMVLGLTAQQVAERAGITLCAIARSDGFEIFTHPHRLSSGGIADVA